MNTWKGIKCELSRLHFIPNQSDRSLWLSKHSGCPHPLAPHARFKLLPLIFFSSFKQQDTVCKGTDYKARMSGFESWLHVWSAEGLG